MASFYVSTHVCCQPKTCSVYDPPAAFKIGGISVQHLKQPCALTHQPVTQQTYSFANFTSEAMRRPSASHTCR